MSKNYNDNNNLFDEVDDNDEEIKEEIIIDNNIDEEKINENKKNENFVNTYDKFLIDSVVLDGQEKRNDYHYLLKNQMINIIDDIKKKKMKSKKIRILSKKKFLKIWQICSLIIMILKIKKKILK